MSKDLKIIALTPLVQFTKLCIIAHHHLLYQSEIHSMYENAQTFASG